MIVHRHELDAEAEPARRLSVVIVTYNSADTLPGLLDSLRAGLRGVEIGEVVVADNASSDNSAEMASGHLIHPRVVRTGRNGGYAAGINAALTRIPADDDVLILNPDIRLRPGAGLALAKHLRNPGVGITVPRILHEDGSFVRSLRREPSVVTAWADALLANQAGVSCDLGEIIHNPKRYQSGTRADWGSGAALAVASRTRQLIGGWDESFFLYSEEVDYQRRARDAGLKIVFVGEAEMVHIGGDYRRNPRLYAILTANRIRYYRRHHGRMATALFRLGVITGECLRSAGGSPVHRAGLNAAVAPRRVVLS